METSGPVPLRRPHLRRQGKHIVVPARGLAAGAASRGISAIDAHFSHSFPARYA
jgi:hypothetical protein